MSYPGLNIAGKPARMSLSGIGITNANSNGAGNTYRVTLSATENGHPFSVAVTAALTDLFGNSVSIIDSLVTTSYSAKPVTDGTLYIPFYTFPFPQPVTTAGGIASVGSYSGSATVNAEDLNIGETVVEFQYPASANAEAARTGLPSLPMANDFISAQLIVTVVA